MSELFPIHLYGTIFKSYKLTITQFYFNFIFTYVNVSKYLI